MPRVSSTIDAFLKSGTAADATLTALEDMDAGQQADAREALGAQSPESAAYLAYDIFSRLPDGNLDGVASASGQSWDVYTTGPAATNMILKNGIATADDWFERGTADTACYATLDCGAPPRRIGAVMSFEKGNGGSNEGTAVLVIGSAVGVFDSCVHCQFTRTSANIQIENTAGGALSFHTLDSETFGVRQVETATAVGAITGSGNLSVTITSTLLPNKYKTISVAVVNGDSTSTWMGKVRTALLADAIISRELDVSGSGSDVTVSPWFALYDNDPTLNIAIANGTAAGITEVVTSVNTTAGSRAFAYGEQIAVEVDWDTATDSLSATIVRSSDPLNPITMSGTHADVSAVGGNFAVWECYGYGAGSSGETPKMASIARYHAVWAASDASADDPLASLDEVRRLVEPTKMSPELVAGLPEFWRKALAAPTPAEALGILGLGEVVIGNQRRNTLRLGQQLVVQSSGLNYSDDGILFSDGSAPDVPRLRMQGGSNNFRLQRMDADGKRTLGSFMLEILDSSPWGSILMKNTTGYFALVPTAGPGLTFSHNSVGSKLEYSCIPSSVTALTDAATIAVNAATNTDFSCLLTSAVGATRILGTPTNPLAGQKLYIRFRQPSSGGPCDITLSAGWSAGPHTIALSTAANASDYLVAVYNGTNSKWDILTFVKGYA